MATTPPSSRKPGQCPCASGEVFGRCCGPVIAGERAARTPEELMRSRYSAYARGQVAYIVATTLPGSPAWQEPLVKWQAGIRAFAKAFRFDGVQILGSREDGARGEVRFRALLDDGRGQGSFEERSDFVRDKGRWFYAGGDMEPEANR